MPIANETLTRTDGDPIEPSDERESFADAPMARVRPGEAAGELLAQARVLGALFGAHSTFGRFQVLRRLGAGGMGVVYEADDPDLARRVALKLVNVAAGDRETALAEAKSLARLSHPNVVPIYDVGLERDHVFLVMELVRGKTLRQWSEGRTLRELLSVYQQAGAALAAAHDAGLVHRDFKPDNAIVGDDGRVRVVDFGLACEADAPAGTTSQRRGVGGTPRFMAPEIKAGTITPAADQYSFAVALADALELAGQSPPRRIADVIKRGRAADPAARFASMRELLRALARDPARTVRRVAAAAGAVMVVVASAFLVGQNQIDACERGADQLDTAWRRSARSAALDRIAGLGAYGESLRPQLEHDLDAYASHWVGESRAACLDRRRGVESVAQRERRRACLQRGIDAFATIGELVRRAEPTTLSELPGAVESMPNPTSCSDSSGNESQRVPAFEKLAPVQRQITNARILVGAGHYEQAVASARKVVAEARALGDGPVLAEALLVQGHAQAELPDRKAAVPILAEATSVALSSHADALAVEAWARRAGAQLTRTDPESAIAGIDVIEPIARRTASATYARAILYNTLGNVEVMRAHRGKAREYFSLGLSEAQKLTGKAALELLPARTNFALVSEDRTRADELLAELDAELTHQLGADHPKMREVRWLRGLVTIENLRQAERLLAPVCDAAPSPPCWTEVGLLRADIGDRAGAMAAMTRARRAPREMREAAGYLSLWTGDPQAAVRQFADAVAAAGKKPNEPLLGHVPRARLTLGLGRARRGVNDLRGARDALESTIEDLVPVVAEYGDTSFGRLLGRARVELAFTLAAMGVSTRERVAVAKPAAEWLRRVGGSPVVLAMLEDLGRE